MVMVELEGKETGNAALLFPSDVDGSEEGFSSSLHD
jgi:hypothetical protein